MSDSELLRELFRAALHAVDAERAVERALAGRKLPAGPVLVLGAGKAAAGMARGAERTLGERIAAGRVTTPGGAARALERVELNVASHPLPDLRSLRAADDALARARSAGARATVLVLLSGGASALWTAPVAPLDLAAKRAVNQLLLGSGVEIGAFNTVRKHLSRIKGGGLLRALHPARCLTLAISDVPGDDPGTIGSGPTVIDSTSYADALAVLRGAALLERIPPAARIHLEEGAAGRRAETAKVDDAALPPNEYVIVARLADALEAAARAAQARGLRVRDLGPALYGEARSLAPRLHQEVLRARADGVDLLIAGGEPTVTLRGSGRGGRAQELALAFALELVGDEAVSALIAGTDGIDGPTDAAGALVDEVTVARGEARGLDARAALARNDAYPFLDAVGALLRTGPTGTNVADLALIRVR